MENITDSNLHDIPQFNLSIVDIANDLNQICKDAFNQQVSRHDALNMKANIYLFVIALLFGIEFLKFNDFISALEDLPFYGLLGELALYFLSAGCFAGAVWHIIKTLKVVDYQGYPSNICTEFEAYNRLEILSSIASVVDEAAAHNREKNDKKAQYLESSLKFIKAGLFLIFAMLFSLIAIAVIGRSL